MKQSPEKYSNHIRRLWVVLKWVVGIPILLFLLISVLLALPPVQKQIIKRGVTWFNSKTGGQLTVDGIDLRLPWYLALENVALYDDKSQLVVKFDELKTSIGWRAILSNTIRIDKLELYGLSANIYCESSNGKWNYDFITDAFASNAEVDTTITASTWDFSVGKVRIGESEIHYYDCVSRDSIALKIGSFDTYLNEFSISNMTFDAEHLALKDAACFVQMPTQAEQDIKVPSSADDESSPMPQIGLGNLNLEQIAFAFSDPNAGIQFDLKLQQFSAQPEELNLNEDRYFVKQILLDGGSISVSTTGPNKDEEPATDLDLFLPVIAGIEIFKIQEFDVSISQIDAQLNTSRTIIEHINIDARDIAANPEKYSFTLASAALDFQGLPALSNLSCALSLDDESLSLKEIDLSLGSSALMGSIHVAYANIDTFLSTYAIKNAIAELPLILVDPADLSMLYHYIEMDEEARMLPLHPLSASLSLTGNAGKLNVNSFKASTGQTSLSLTGVSTGKEWSEQRIQLSTLDLSISRTDLLPFLPAGTDTEVYPEQVKFKGHAFASGKNSALTGSLQSEYGALHVQASAGGWNSDTINATAHIYSDELNLSKYAGGENLRLCFSADFKGKDLTGDSLEFSAVVEAQELYYQEALITGIYAEMEAKNNRYDFLLEITDPNAVVALKGDLIVEDSLINLHTEGLVSGFDFQSLKFTDYDLRLKTHFDLDYTSAPHLQSGTMLIDGTTAVKNGERFDITPIEASLSLGLDSTLIKINSEYVNLNLESNMALDSITGAFTDLTEREKARTKNAADYLELDFTMNNSEILRKLILEDLETFEPSFAKASYSAIDRKLTASASFPQIDYSGISVHNLELEIDGSNGILVGQLSAGRIGLDSMYISSPALHLAYNNPGSLYTLSIGNPDSLLYKIGAEVNYQQDSQSWLVTPIDTFTLNTETWKTDPEAEIEISKTDVSIHSFAVLQGEKWISINKAPGDGTLEVGAKNFELQQISALISGGEDLLGGLLSGTVVVQEDGTFTGNGSVKELIIRGTEFGNLNWDAVTNKENYTVKAILTGGALEAKVNGVLLPVKEGSTGLDLQVDMTEMDVSLLSSLAPSLIAKSSGDLQASLHIGGTTAEPSLVGNASFSNILLELEGNSAYYSIPKGTVKLEPETIMFPSLTVVDSIGNKLTADGSITHSYFQDMVYDITVKSDNFTLMDLRPGDDPNLQGKLIVSSDISIKGPQLNPAIVSSITLQNGSDITYVIPESEYADFQSDDLVEWVEFNPIAGTGILSREKSEEEIAATASTKLDLRGFVNIDPATNFKIVIDPLAGDYLKVKGGGKLALSYDPSGRVNIGGTYEIVSGEYLMTFYNLASRKFTLVEGSKITWNGDPYSADLDIKARYSTKATLSSMMGTQAAGNDAMRQQVSWDIIMNLSGGIDAPEISFEIAIDPDQRGIMGGVVDSKLAQINANENELNKQVFALLIFNTFINESSGQESAYLVANQARNSASQILTQQLNQIGDGLIGGVELNFDLQSYSAQTGGGETDLSVDLSKSLFDDRVVVTVGSTMVLESSSAASANENQQFMTNVVVEYKITPDGRYRFKAYSKTDLEDIVVGRINRTGVGVLFRREFDTGDEIFQKPEKTEGEK